MKKIIALIGSGRKNGNIATIINEITRGASDYNAEIKTYNLTDMDIKPCHNCFSCREKEQCYLTDDMTEVIENLKDADVVLFSSPIYLFQVSGQVKLLMDRLYPLLSGTPGKYGLRYGVKRTIAIYSQGSPDIDSFKKYFELNKESLALLGLNVEHTLICTNANNSLSASENKELLQKAYTIGKNLFQ